VCFPVPATNRRTTLATAALARLALNDRHCRASHDRCHAACCRRRLLTARYLDDWLEHTVKPSQKPLTYEKYGQVVRTHLKPAIGKVVLAKLNSFARPEDPSEMAKKGVRVSTINGMRTALGAALAQAERWGLVARNVVHLVDGPRAPEAEPRVLQPEEATAFLMSARGDDLEYLFATMLATGLRAGEARGLRWADVHVSGPAQLFRSGNR